MAKTLYLLTEGDKKLLAGLIDRERQRLKTPPSRQPPDDRFYSPEMYIAKIPEGGIDAREDDEIHSAMCEICFIYHEDITTSKLGEAGFDLEVFNLSTIDMTEDMYVTIERDKFGKWIIPCPGYEFEECP